jgi:hypothetical protein
MRFDQMRRREFISLVVGAATGWPPAARAQEAGRTYRLGFLIPASRESPAVVAFLDEQDIEDAFSRMRRQDAGAVVVVADTLFFEQRQRIAELAIKHRLPSMFSFREHVQAGGLMSYGQHLADSYRRAATYVDRIFKGAKPSELPVELSTKLELLVNLKTAKELGLEIPPCCWPAPTG